MIVNELLILDQKEKTSRKFIFNSRENIIVGEDNSVGKSSLMKSLYYALGVDDLSRMPVGWESQNMIFKTKIEYENNLAHIIRNDSIFYVSKDNSKYNVYTLKEYGDWLQEFLKTNVELFLRNKENDGRQLVYPGALFVPFNIDQDISWIQSPYRDSKTMGMYKSGSHKELFEIYFKISNENIQKNEDTISILNQEINILNDKQEILKELITDYHNKERISYGVKDIESIERYFKLLQKINTTILKYASNKKVEIQKANNLYMELINLNKIKQSIENNLKNIKDVCSQCGSKLTIKILSKQLEFEINKTEVEFEIDRVKKMIESHSKKLKNLDKQKKDSEKEYDYYFEIVNKDEQLKNIDEYLDKQSSALAYDKLEVSREGYFLEKNKKEIYRKELQDINKELKKELKQIKDSIKKDYEIIFSEIKFAFLNNVEEYDIKKRPFLNLNKVKGSGTDLNIKLLLLYLTYFNLLSKYSLIMLPSSIDSIIFSEVGNENIEKMFRAIEEYFLSLPSQTFFTIIIDNKDYLKNYEKYNKILLKSNVRLLNKKNYDNHLKEFEFIRT